ncbi:TPA: hypothetical protein ACJOZE_000886 [Streptococcus pyogenes]|uniref:hypothetical protein n=1 Tax=Streptococcus pyogenes TaxID=1314 RepID=UPI0007C3F8DD|nr:hypothetical protein [Streptococcus pyogenes]QBX10819.1 hypothetical protein JavanS482_0006 [Streptococcus satellite phage Javan482]OAC61650.1 hypothetical protein AWT95_07240 [Streptococcus pyogenes]OAC68767.1 hypothetical protein AWU07_00445 [Streptococcus pyogenes]OAC80091.1 hypothetical protein AWT94_00445 [Streptococcus pyogenes]OUI73031.1 hypothetical protein B7R60_07315 [Streptococcus pyogenes]
MIQELNLTTGQLLVLLPLLILLLLITLRKHSYLEIDLPDIEQRTNKGINPNYGAYIQSQNHYYN